MGKQTETGAYTAQEKCPSSSFLLREGSRANIVVTGQVSWLLASNAA